MNLDRITPPAFIDLEPFTLLKPEKLQASSGLTAFILEHGQQEVCRIEISFPAGKWYEPYTGVAFFTAKLMAEGTQTKSSGKLQQMIAQYGSFFEVQPGNDQVSFTLFCLSRYLKPMLELLEEIIEQPLMAEEELEKLKTQAKQNYALNLNKTSFLANKTFQHLMFGEEHPYGKSLDEQAIEKVQLEDVIKYHRHAYHWNQASVFVSGMGEQWTLFFEDWLKKKSVNGPGKGMPVFNVGTPHGKEIKIEKSGAVQSSVKAGFFVPPRTIPDYPAMYLYNEIFGGYFGSRLMQNIREDKGFTYGIYSSLVQDMHVSYWAVQTDVNGDNALATVREIRFEMDRMCQEMVNEEELKIVKNYILGSFISSLDTPFSFMDRFKATYFNQLGEQYYEELMKRLLQVTGEQIKAVAVKYFDPAHLNVVIAGK